MSGTTLKPWNKLVRLREDVRTGELSQSILLHAGFNCFTAVVLLFGL